MSRTPGKGALGSELKSTKIPGRARISAVLFSPTILDALYGFKKVWFSHCSPLHSSFDQSKKFSVLSSLTQAQRGYSGFQVTGMIEWGQKSKPKKIPWASNKSQKNPWTKIYPPKNPMPNFRAIIKISA